METQLTALAGSFLGGDFSTGEMGNFHPALTHESGFLLGAGVSRMIQKLRVLRSQTCSEVSP